MIFTVAIYRFFCEWMGGLLRANYVRIGQTLICRHNENALMSIRANSKKLYFSYKIAEIKFSIDHLFITFAIPS
jgi:histidinol phosphatase-like enzyme